MGEKDKGSEPRSRSIASEKVRKSSAERKKPGHVRIASGQSNSRRSVGAKASGVQEQHAKTAESGTTQNDQNLASNKLNSAGAFDIQMDQLHVVGQLTADRTALSSKKSPKEENDPGL